MRKDAEIVKGVLLGLAAFALIVTAGAIFCVRAGEQAVMRAMR